MYIVPRTAVVVIKAPWSHSSSSKRVACSPAAAHAVAYDNVDVVVFHPIDVVGGVRAMVRVGIAHGLEPAAASIHHSEEMLSWFDYNCETLQTGRSS
jgi:hypothetical protein